MSVVSLHPESLLDLDARGELTPAQRDQLEEHLAQCETCRLERLVRRDFRLEEEPLDADVDFRRLLSEVLAPGTQDERLRPSPDRRSVSHRMRAMLLVAAVLLVASASAAAGWKGIRAIQARVTALTTIETQPSPQPAAAAVRHGTQPATVDCPATPAQADSALVPVMLPQAALSTASAPPPSVLSLAPSSSAVAVSAPTRQAGTSTALPADALSMNPAPAPSAVSSVDPTAHAPVSDAAALFARANRARWTGNRERAVELYRALVERYPASVEAHESQAVLGQVLLVADEASAALRCFDDYLRTGGPLQEDVMADRARALTRLGRAHDEAEAWTSLLRAYPGSVHAERARSRLRELGEL